MSKGTLTIKVVGDAAKFNKTMSDVDGRLSTFGQKVSGAVGTAMKIGAAAVVAGVATAVGLGLQRLVGIEEAQAKLRGLGHDAATVDQIMVNALASVKGTAFGLADAATAAAGAIASGVKPGEDLERTLKLVGDTATIAGAGFDEMGAIFNKVGASNRLTMGEVNQLADRGVPIMQWLADQYGVTAIEARKMVESGQVDFAAFRDAIETNIGGAALESGNTTMGAFNNMKAAAGRLGAALVGPVFGQIKEFFGGVTGWIDQLTEKAGPFAEVFGQRIAAAFEVLGQWWAQNAPAIMAQVAEVFGAITSWIADVTPHIQSWISNNLDNIQKWWSDHGPKVIKAIELLRDALVKAVDKMIEAVQHIVDEWDKYKIAVGVAVAIMIPHWVALTAAAVASSISQVGAWVATGAAAIAAAVVHSAQVMIMIVKWALLAPTAIGYAALVVAAWVSTSAAAITSAVVHSAQVVAMIAKWVLLGATAMAQAVVIAAAWLISMGPIVLVVAAVAALAVAFIKNWDTIRSAVITGVQFVVDKFLWLAETIVGTAAKAFGWVPGIGPKLKEAERAVATFRENVNRELAAIRDRTVNVRINREDNSWRPSSPLARSPRMHTGGIFNAATPGGAGLALLRDGERVTTPEAPAAPATVRLDDAQLRQLARLVVQMGRAS